jgi:Alternative complex III, ActD subunit
MSAPAQPLVIAEFRDADDLCAAARNVRRSGFHPIDALTPCQVEGLDDALHLPESPIRWPMLIAAVLVAASAYALEFWTAVYAYPIDSGGRPLNSWPIFLLVPFEVGVLAAAVTGFAALLILCGLPRVNHPLFDCDAIERATDDRYFLLVRGPPGTESDTLKGLLLGARAVRIEEQT